MKRLAVAGFLACAAWAQKFEVASIKPNKSDDHRMMFGLQPGGRFAATGVNLRMLITFAYDIKQYQVTGLPGWADTDRWDISAKEEGPDDTPSNGTLTQEQQRTRQEKTRAALRDLLADRFGLRIRRETKEMPVYNLVVAKGGPKLVESKDDAPPLIEGGRGAGRAQMVRMGRGQITGQGVPIMLIVNQLSNTLGRNVIDKTELTAKYDIKLTWAPDESQPMMRGDGPPPEAAGETGPSVFTAIQEQLGLKLEPSKGPVEMVIVEKIERPTEN